MNKVIISTLFIVIIVLLFFIFPTSQGCDLSDDTILLQQAVSDGWTVVIVENVLATSPNVTMITN